VRHSGRLAHLAHYELNRLPRQLQSSAYDRSLSQRIVCLTEEPTEVLYALGEQHRIVGISGFTVRPAQARKEKPRVSAFTSARIERILALKPDFVVASQICRPTSPGPDRQGIEVWISNHRSIEGILVISAGSGTGRFIREGRSLYWRIEQQLAVVREQARRLTRRRGVLRGVG